VSTGPREDGGVPRIRRAVPRVPGGARPEEDWSGANITGGATSSPIVVWDPVPGASSYDYDVTRFIGGACDFTWSKQDHWRGTTAVGRRVGESRAEISG